MKFNEAVRTVFLHLYAERTNGDGLFKLKYQGAALLIRFPAWQLDVGVWVTIDRS